VYYKICKVVLFLILSTLLLIFTCYGELETRLPDLKGRVNDFTSSLSSDEIYQLETKLSEFEKQKGTQIALIIVNTTGAIVIEDYAVKLQEKWKIGREKINDGVLLVVAKNDRKLKIEVGYGLEGAIPDVKAKQIIEDVIIPEFKQGKIFQGINLGIDSIINLIKGETLPAPKSASEIDLNPDSLGFLIIFAAVILQPLHSLLKKTIGNIPSASIFSLGAGAIGYLFLPFVFVAIFSLIVFITLLFGAGSGSRYSSSSWGGSSGGGFSGGGGRSGGGGASGSW